MKINLKPFENVKEGTYDSCQDEWDDMLGELVDRRWQTNGGDEYGPWARFSMYDEVSYNEDEWIVKYPNFKDNSLIVEGKVEVVIKDWFGASVVLNYPRAGDIYRFFANNHDDHHGYLEAVVVEDNKIVLYSGS